MSWEWRRRQEEWKYGESGEVHRTGNLDDTNILLATCVIEVVDAILVDTLVFDAQKI